MQIKNYQKNKAFTLVELMVATSIFVVIMLASMGSLFTLLDASKSARALRFAMDNVNFAMESMSRSIRMGTYYKCVTSPTSITMTGNSTDFGDCSGGGTFIAFIPQPYSGYVAGTRIGYKLSLRADNITNTVQRCDGSNCIDIVSPDVDIQRLNFIVKGSDPYDGIQASVYIIMKGTVKVKGVPTTFSLQTMASQRNF